MNSRQHKSGFVATLALSFMAGMTITAAASAVVATQPAWWTNTDAGWIGGIGGSVVGCMGGLIGTLAGIGRARRFVLATLLAMVGGGAILLMTGIIALIMGQPYAVYYPLLLLGGITFIVSLSIRPGVRRSYEARELARMKAMDT